MTVKKDDQFAARLRAALMEHVEATPARERRTRQRTAVGAGVGILILRRGSTHAAAVLGLPRAEVVTGPRRSRRSGIGPTPTGRRAACPNAHDRRRYGLRPRPWDVRVCLPPPSRGQAHVGPLG